MRSSNGERKIYEILAASNLPFAEEYEFADLMSTSGRRLRFDFCVFKPDRTIDFLIEFQGKQHYLPVKHFGGEKAVHRQRYNDNLKRRYCLDRGLNLVTIPYWDEPLLSYDYIMRAAGHQEEV